MSSDELTTGNGDELLRLFPTIINLYIKITTNPISKVTVTPNQAFKLTSQSIEPIKITLGGRMAH